MGILTPTPVSSGKRRPSRSTGNRGRATVLLWGLAVAGMLMGVAPAFAANTETNNQQVTVHISQTNSTYSEIQPSSRAYVGNRGTFQAYKHGDEKLFIAMDNIANATLFINGKVVSLKSAMGGSKAKNVGSGSVGSGSVGSKSDNSNATTITQNLTAINISKNVVAGTNFIRVENITSADESSNATINIYIPYPTLDTAKPNSGKGFTPANLKKVDEIIEADIENGFPGAVLAIVKDGALVKLSAYGNQRIFLDGGNIMDTPQPMTVNTMFDMASVTKVYATTLALMKLSYEGKLDINKPVYYYLPDFAKNNTGKFDKRTVTVRNLLEHSGGLQPEIVFFNENKVPPNLFSLNKNTTKRIVLQNAPLVYRPGTQYVYSDTGFIILGFIVEKITNMPLDSYVEQYIYKPMGLNSTVFNPLTKSFRKEEFAATEVWGNTRKFQRNFNASREYVLQGEAHDEKAWYSMGGVSGHAGLFSNATDLAILGQLMINKGGYGDVKIFDENTYNLFTKSLDNHSDQGLGWRKRGSWEEDTKTWMFGDYASYNTIGHTGWVGNVVLVDPEMGLSIVLLTNKKHTDIDENIVFDGDRFETGRYGSIVNKVYEALRQ